MSLVVQFPKNPGVYLLRHPKSYSEDGIGTVLRIPGMGLVIWDFWGGAFPQKNLGKNRSLLSPSPKTNIKK